MSLVPIGITVAIAAAEQLLSPFFSNRANIGGVLPDVSIKEIHDDEMTVTRHPVEQNASIADHAFKEPVKLTMRVGWSNSSIQAGGDPNYINEIYQQLLTLQASRQPFSIVTSKRSYVNMMMRHVRTDTDQETAHSLILVAEFEEVIIVSTQTVSVPPASAQANPQLTGAVSNAGQQSLQPAPNFNASAL